MSTRYPDFLKYIKSLILGHVKENIFCAWTGQVRHFGNTISNVVEYTHTTRNNCLKLVKLIFCRCWYSMNPMIRNQHNKIHTSFGLKHYCIRTTIQRQHFLFIVGWHLSGEIEFCLSQSQVN